ncbi:hypothetical protein [Acinetobacter tianfuensis]|uniref:Lipoprotein n=1 Tax=Acinetobacter tianfuensis TaxID=2419603 RepID=A0A3A8EEK1_9GAMM|nr:hypothetical protein [Acinetobacter tianfuensis]RKG31936.1 hypothetical protein D7V32_07170 [Acinetobacter tianfuensis]
MKNSNPLKAILAVIGALALTACQPEQQTQANNQQNFVCKSLIHGFLSAQKLTQYELEQIQPVTASGFSQKLYIYKARSDTGINVMPQQTKLRFACEQMTARKFQIKLRQAQGPEYPLLSVELPETQQMQQLTAYHLSAD